MTIQRVEYMGSFPSVNKCPKHKKVEYAFIGRSNVGKSSLINMLSGRKSLAKVSNTPGKTQMINFYEVDEKWIITDLPGYGYARLSKKHRDSLETMIQGYLQYRENMSCAFVLIDGFIPPQSIDLEFINWMGKANVPFVIVFTKLDRLISQKKMDNVNLFKNEMLKTWNELPPLFFTSSTKKEGREEILNYIEEINP
jgi:ribosome biogenesis GTP-binding protein YsxC/EngB